jgi:Bifunctional DNA primase/polymerase, N-terminal
MPTVGGTNGYDGSVKGDRRGRGGDMVHQTEGPYWAATQGSSRGRGAGEGTAGYSRELLRGALVYAGRGVPVFLCEAGGKRPLTVDAFLEATTDEARIRGW